MSFISIDLEEYERLARQERALLEQTRTLDMVMDVLKENACTFDFQSVYIHSIQSPEELANIFRYRMPEEWKELEAAVIERETRDNDGVPE